MSKKSFSQFFAHFFKKIWRKNKVIVPDHNKLRKKKVDNETIRARISTQGWKLLEIPIKKNNNNQTIVARWKIIASKEGKSIEVGGQTIEEALINIGKSLGVIARES